MNKIKITFILLLGMIILSCLSACSSDDSKEGTDDNLRAILLDNK